MIRQETWRQTEVCGIADYAINNNDANVLHAF